MSWQTDWRNEEGYVLKLPFEDWSGFMDVAREYAEGRLTNATIAQSLFDKLREAGRRSRHLEPLLEDDLTECVHQRFNGDGMWLPWSDILDRKIAMIAAARFDPATGTDA